MTAFCLQARAITPLSSPTHGIMLYIIAGDRAHVCEQLASSHYVTVERLGVGQQLSIASPTAVADIEERFR